MDSQDNVLEQGTIRNEEVNQEAAAPEVVNETHEAAEEAQPRKVYATKAEVLSRIQEIAHGEETLQKEEIDYLKTVFYKLHIAEREAKLKAYLDAGGDPEQYQVTPDPEEEAFKAEMGIIKEKRALIFKEQEAEKQENLAKKLSIIEKIKNMLTSPEDANKSYQEFKTLQQQWREIKSVPAEKASELWRNYQLYVEQFYDLLKLNSEAREYDFKKNLELKTKLCEAAEKLAEEEDVVSAFHQLQKLHQEYREIGPVSKELREEIWNRFKTASTVINKRHQQHFEGMRAKEEENLARKTALCEKVEAIDFANFKSYSEWDEATKAILELQAAWKELGFASRKVNNQLFARFREACDKFFSAKAEYFKKVKEESRENLAKKEALCEKAEALAADYDRKGALDEMQALQKEWREVGVVRRKQGDEIWKRFCNALDEFYGNRKKLFSGKKAEEGANLKAKQEVIEKLKEISEDSDRSDVIDTIRDLQAEWQNIGHVPFKDKDTVNQAYRAELDRLFSAFDIKETRQRVRRFENDLKKFAGEEGKLNREREKMVRALENRLSEAKTIENNLGFFNVKSNAGNSMVKEMEKKIQKLKAEAEEIREKIAILDAQEAGK